MNLGFVTAKGHPGQHIGHFYRTREEARNLCVSFLKEGLLNGDICVYRAGADDVEREIVSALESCDIEVGAALHFGQLILERKASSVESVLRQATRGKPLLWVADATDSIFFDSYPDDSEAVFLCQYDLTKLSGSSLLDAQLRHPLWIIQDTLHSNPLYRAPSREAKSGDEPHPVWMEPRESFPLKRNFRHIVGQSHGIRRVLKAVETVAPTDAGVLIYGETGTGKELIVRSLHELSPRKERPLIKINCAALPAGLMESELFGHERGSFTGAFARKLGRFEIADGGTIFLDEIGDLQVDLQSKLLRVLQEGEFERVGGHQTIHADVRVIAATNRDLEKSVNEGKFRADLFYRLNVFPIHVPPLRERKEDIPLLVKYFVMKHGARFRKNIERIPQMIVDALLAYSWPGNIRELENLIERAVILCQGSQLEPGKWLPQPGNGPADLRIPTLEQLEKEHILEVLQLACWRVSGERGAARLLGLKPTTLEARMRKLGISRDQL